MNGNRISDRSDGSLSGINPGDYWKDTRNGYFYCACPVRDSEGGLVIGGLGHHDITEHEDGTITVSPSILVSGGSGPVMKELYHGFLEHGIWRL